MPEYVIYLPSTSAHYDEIMNLGSKLRARPTNLNRDTAALRPLGASHIAWVTTDRLMVARMRRLGALIVLR